MGSPAAKSFIVFANKETILARELVRVFHLREKGVHQGYRSERRGRFHWGYMGEQGEGSHQGHTGEEGRIPPGSHR